MLGRLALLPPQSRCDRLPRRFIPPSYLRVFSALGFSPSTVVGLDRSLTTDRPVHLPFLFFRDQHFNPISPVIRLFGYLDLFFCYFLVTICRNCITASTFLPRFAFKVGHRQFLQLKKKRRKYLFSGTSRFCCRIRKTSR